MPASRCRICRGTFHAEPLLAYRNMPKAAQHFPDREALPDERGVDLILRQCASCGLVQLENDPVPYYREVIRAAGISEEMKAYRRGQIGGIVSRFGLGGRKAVEIGCGRGEFLSIMQSAGLDARGLEHGEESVSACRRNGLNVVRGFVEDENFRIEGAPFAAFFILNVLEHFPDPGSSLRGIAANLNADAIGVVEVPNFDMIIRERLFTEFIGDHLCYFTEATLRTTLETNGFSVLECAPTWHDYILSAIVRKRTPTDLAAFHGSRERLRNDVDAFIGRFGKRRVAIWGAGHQALAIMSLLELGDSVAYVVDSAPFKQNRFTPATHLRVVPPETLESEPVDAVIVMAASYSDEVASIIQERFGKKLVTAIVRGYTLENLAS